MFNFFLRFFSFGMYTLLRFAVAITNNAYFTAMDIFIIMADILRTNIALPDPDSTANANRNSNIRQIIFTNRIRPISSLSHTYTQTDQCTVLASRERERSSNPDIFVYNLDASKKLTITHKNIDSNSTSTKSEDLCQRSKTKFKHPQVESIEYDCLTVSLEESVCSDSSQSSSSNMSIENDVSDGQILQFSHIMKDGEGYDRSSKSAEENQCENKSENTVDESDFEVDSQKELLETKSESCFTGTQKTSSPIGKSAILSLIDPCDQLENTFIKKKCETENLSSETSDESSKFDGDETHLNFFEKTVLLNDSSRRRFSLPARFNTSREATLHFEAIRNKIEDTIKNTSRHEKSTREIKYPLLGETFLARDEESKEVFSCSSYESLPVSEHLHNAFEKSTLYSLYKDDFISTSTPDFSSVDDFVEAFNKIKSTLSVSEQVKKKHPLSLSLSTESIGEEGRLVRAHSCDIEETKNSQGSESNALINGDNKAILKNTLDEQDMPSKYGSIGDASTSNFSLNSVDLKTDECAASSRHVIDDKLHKNDLLTCSGEKFSEEMHEIKSIFERIMSEIDNEQNVPEKCGKNNRKNPECESNESIFFEKRPCSFQFTLTEPLQFSQDQTIIEISSMQPLQGQNNIDEEIEVASLENKLAELIQNESSENSKNLREANSQFPVTISEELTITESQNSEPVPNISELKNIKCVLLNSEEASKFLSPKVKSEMKVEAHENGEKQDQSFTSVTETDNEFKMADESSRIPSREDDNVSILMSIDDFGDEGKSNISPACSRNESFGNDKFLSFADESSFYNDSNLEDSTWARKELTCK